MTRLTIIALAIVSLCTLSAGWSAGLDAQAKMKTMTATGAVKSVSATSLTVTADGKDTSFTIDNTTRFIGKGLGTKAKAGPITATDAVGAGDKVRVTYHQADGTLHAASVSVTAKAIPTK